MTRVPVRARIPEQRAALASAELAEPVASQAVPAHPAVELHPGTEPLLAPPVAVRPALPELVLAPVPVWASELALVLAWEPIPARKPAQEQLLRAQPLRLRVLSPQAWQVYWPP